MAFLERSLHTLFGSEAIGQRVNYQALPQRGTSASLLRMSVNHCNYRCVMHCRIWKLMTETPENNFDTMRVVVFSILLSLLVTAGVKGREGGREHKRAHKQIILHFIII